MQSFPVLLQNKEQLISSPSGNKLTICCTFPLQNSVRRFFLWTETLKCSGRHGHIVCARTFTVRPRSKLHYKPVKRVGVHNTFKVKWINQRPCTNRPALNATTWGSTWVIDKQTAFVLVRTHKSSLFSHNECKAIN